MNLKLIDLSKRIRDTLNINLDDDKEDKTHSFIIALHLDYEIINEKQLYDIIDLIVSKQDRTLDETLNYTDNLIDKITTQIIQFKNRKCERCKGTGTSEELNWSGNSWLQSTSFVKCPLCYGTGIYDGRYDGKKAINFNGKMVEVEK